METQGLKQYVDEPTHQKGNILDLIFTEVTSQMNVRQLEMLDFISDHHLISATIDVKKDVLKITKKKFRNLKEVNPSMLIKNFHLPHLNQNTNTNEAYNQLNLQLQEMLDISAPEKIVKRPEKPQNLWFNHTLSEQWKTVKNREITWSKYKEQHCWKAYTMERNRYIYQLHYFKKQSISKSVFDCKKDTKELFCLVNKLTKLTGNTTQNPLPSNKTDEGTCRRLGQILPYQKLRK